jgi:hypothetical protein
MENGRAPKRRMVNQRVSGSFGEWIEGPTKRQRRQRLYGHIVTAVGEKRYLVRFDDGQEKECSSKSLKVERMHEALPPDVVPPPPSNVPEQRELDLLAEEVDNQEEDEHLALAAPDGEEREDREEESENEQEDENAEPPLGMPGQLPTEKDQPNIQDYHEIKRVTKESGAASHCDIQQQWSNN